MNPSTGRLQHYPRHEDVAAFHRRFATINTLSAETGRHRNAMRAEFAAHGIVRFAPDGRDVGAIYFREEVDAALARRRAAAQRCKEPGMPF